MYTKKEYQNAIQSMLVYLTTEQEKNVDRSFYKTTKQIIPEFGCDNDEMIFGYFYKGQFLPSGSSDGKVWKPSQGAKPTGKGLMKRYFYWKDEENDIKINRQVVWLESNSKYCYVEYRVGKKACINFPSQISGPDGFNLRKLFDTAQKYNEKHQTFIVEPKKSVYVKKEKPSNSSVKKEKINKNISGKKRKSPEPITISTKPNQRSRGKQTKKQKLQQRQQEEEEQIQNEYDEQTSEFSGNEFSSYEFENDEFSNSEFLSSDNDEQQEDNIIGDILESQYSYSYPTEYSSVDSANDLFSSSDSFLFSNGDEEEYQNQQQSMMFVFSNFENNDFEFDDEHQLLKKRKLSNDMFDFNEEKNSSDFENEKELNESLTSLYEKVRF